MNFHFRTSYIFVSLQTRAWETERIHHNGMSFKNPLTRVSIFIRWRIHSLVAVMTLPLAITTMPAVGRWLFAPLHWLPVLDDSFRLPGLSEGAYKATVPHYSWVMSYSSIYLIHVCVC